MRDEGTIQDRLEELRHRQEGSFVPGVETAIAELEWAIGERDEPYVSALLPRSE